MGNGLKAWFWQSAPIPLAAELHCPGGETLALVGPSGSGKTTILRCLAGLLNPAHGAIACHDKSWLDTAHHLHLRPQARRVGFVFQDYGLFPHLTALDNVAEAVPARSRTARRARAREWLARVHLAGLEERLPRVLSGGQRQRVAVARALGREPDILLLDEPFSAVDRATRERLYREMAELKAALRMTTVLVTHDLQEASLLADRITVVHHGRTLQSGAPADVVARPATATVARLVGVRNLFTGYLRRFQAIECKAFIAWGEVELEAHTAVPPGAPGTACDWCISASKVILHRRDRPSRGERENPVRGEIIEYLRLGDEVLIGIAPYGVPAAIIRLTVSWHVAERNRLGLGETATVSLLAAGIHLMPVESVLRTVPDQ